MGSIDIFFNETVTINRMTEVEGTNKNEFTEHIAALKCAIQAADSEFSNDVEVGYGKDFTMFCETADVQEGDRVIRTISGTDYEYRVNGIEKYDWQGHDHMEVSIRIFES